MKRNTMTICHYRKLSVAFLFTFFYVVYQIVSASPLESLEKMVEQATLQKIIAIINVVSIFLLSFAFEEQIRKLKLD